MRAKRVIEVVTAAVLLLGSFAAAHADGESGAEIYAQGLAGAVPACATCHGANGEGVGEFPRLAGLPSSYVSSQLAAYRNRERPNEVMRAIVEPLDAGQMQSVADYVASLSAPYLPAPAAPADVLAAGARLVTLGKWSEGVPACRDCHGPALLGGGPALPGLAGQPEGYLLGQLEAFRAGSRPAGPLGIMGRIAARLDPAEMRAAAAYTASLREDETTEVPRGETSDWEPHAQNADGFEPPPESALPPRPEDAAAVLLGENIFLDTPRYAPGYAGNVLSCRNCHTDRGRNPVSSPMWAAVPIYPKYRSKNRTVNSLAMRIEGCFRYSQNGTPPPPDSKEIVALMTYMNWLATGLPMGIQPKASGYPDLAAPEAEPDRLRGKEVYADSCAVCHGEDGQGRVVADAQVMPPLWGPQSYNWGAGMHTLDNAAAFVYANMPYGATGTLTPQQAWDVAAWLDSQPRPQDPRFTETVEKTHELYHKGHVHDYYGTAPDGVTLGAPGTLEAWQQKNDAPPPAGP
jgi:thiosulfate dehydrogenase